MGEGVTEEVISELELGGGPELGKHPGLPGPQSTCDKAQRLKSRRVGLMWWETKQRGAEGPVQCCGACGLWASAGEQWS